ncbi:MAG: NUDIX domain-containing protein [Patescibacteria group bacterium]|nr:NUDIX domain-containing protein [Patescibacteria group bacterium]
MNELLPKHQLRGNEENPYHLSIGQVVFNNQGEIALIQKPVGGPAQTKGEVTLPRETAYSDETFENCIQRGAESEIGITVAVTRFVGSQITHFRGSVWRNPDVEIEKTTLYFLTRMTGTAEKDLTIDEVEDEVIWRTPEDAIGLLKQCDNPEAEIVARIVEAISDK